MKRATRIADGTEIEDDEFERRNRNLEGDNAARVHGNLADEGGSGGKKKGRLWGRGKKVKGTKLDDAVESEATGKESMSAEAKARARALKAKKARLVLNDSEERDPKQKLKPSGIGA